MSQPDPEDAVVYVDFGEPVTGWWCDACLLPAGLAFPVMLIAEDCSTWQVWTGCINCHTDICKV